ncbi:disulfide bond formation protein B [Dokdonella sp.]|uniref:disulfide bond formation protein B n=1 Tax=Dokdonella sp. TaxID=2291710 RepID=UPI0031BE279D|nr:disulfide bond formation protein B [Dokdonella sp.]
MNPNPFAWPFRAQFLLGGVVCCVLVAYALFEQFQVGLEPCPKCILQRIAFIVAGVLFLVGAAHGPGAVGRRIYGVLVALAVASGAVVSVRHIIVQMTPTDPLLAGCGPGLNYLIDAYPLAEAIKKAFIGTGNCADIDWSFLGLSMPAWALVWFVLLGGGALWAGFRRRLA